MEQKEVFIYSTPNCIHCNHAKAFFAEKGIEYTNYNVAEDLEKRKDMVEMTGQMGVPVIHIGDDVFVGFDQSQIAAALGVS